MQSDQPAWGGKLNLDVRRAGCGGDALQTDGLAGGTQGGCIGVLQCQRLQRDAAVGHGLCRVCVTPFDQCRQAAVEQALAAGPPEMTGQFVPMLQMAEGMAKPGENGALVWELESTATGGFLVNGTNMMGAQ